MKSKGPWQSLIKYQPHIGFVTLKGLEYTNHSLSPILTPLPLTREISLMKYSVTAYTPNINLVTIVFSLKTPCFHLEKSLDSGMLRTEIVESDICQVT